MRIGPFAAVRYPGYGGFVRLGHWSVSVLWKASERDYRPLSERYGTTRTWTLGPVGIRRHGHLHKGTQ